MPSVRCGRDATDHLAPATQNNEQRHIGQAGNTWPSYASYRRWQGGGREPGQVSSEHWGWQDSPVTVRAADEGPAVLLQVKVWTVGSEPVIWRLLEMDSFLALDRVHEVIQTAVGWRDSHLHSFTDTDPFVRLRAVNGHVREPRRWVPVDLLEDSDDDLPETDWTLGQVLTPESGPLFYEYDFGDGWIHRLGLTKTLSVPANAPRARLVDGARRAPLEDSGGIYGYHDLLDALADAGHEKHNDLQAWVAWTAGPMAGVRPGTAGYQRRKRGTGPAVP
jgi:hypothetical protein